MSESHLTNAELNVEAGLWEQSLLAIAALHVPTSSRASFAPTEFTGSPRTHRNARTTRHIHMLFRSSWRPD
ncbi:hypothetical protein DZG01_20430 [Pseudomonas fluorescens]|nr:hypothetical protein DZG01_20430 [Pseudomonas fluorescens]